MYHYHASSNHFIIQVPEADLIKLATAQYDKQQELEKQKTIFDRIMAYTSQNYNKQTNKFQPPINAYVGDYALIFYTKIFYFYALQFYAFDVLQHYFMVYKHCQCQGDYSWKMIKD